MRMVESTRGETTVIEIEGILNLLDAPALNARLNELIAARHYQIVLDLGAVTLIDSTGFGVLLGIEKKLRNFRSHLFLARTPDNVQHILESNGLGGLLEHFDSVDAACAAYADSD